MFPRNVLLRTGAVITTMVAALALAACRETTSVDETPSPAPAVQLKDVVIPSLPSPFYHFDYDDLGRISSVSYASGLTMYTVAYDSDRISQVVNKTLANRDRLEYVYDDAGRVAIVKYVDASDVLYTFLALVYEGDKLVELERNRKVDNVGFIIDKTMSFSYYADGNLRTITERRPRVEGRQDETTSIITYSQYDDGINVDGFSLIHDDFFDHLVLLPGVRLQQGNPAKEVRTGDGAGWTVDYSYVYDAQNRPLVKSGNLTFTSGPNAGQLFQVRSEFSYY
jgi:hypothetical protein